MGRRLALLTLCFLTALAVDESKFRTCDQNSFCRRFKRWQGRPQLEEPLWVVVPGSRSDLADGGFSYLVRHASEESPSLVLKINIYDAGMVRLQLTESAPLHPRYQAPAGDVVVEPTPPPAAHVDIDENERCSVFRAGAVTATLQHVPLAVSISVDGEVVQQLNARNFLNFERYRQRDPEVEAKGTKLTVDAAAWPGMDAEGLWEEYFGPHLDTRPRGPAAVGLDVTFAGDVVGVYGLPLHAAPCDLRTYAEPYRCFNLDVFEYLLDSPMALYGSVPLLQAVRRGSKVSGFLWLNPSDTFVQVERTREGPVDSWWVSESGVMDMVVLTGPAPGDVTRQLHLMTGFAPLPPLWALGWHQCKWNYYSEEEVEEVNAGYTEHDLPLDAIWLDIEHTDDKRYFTWDPAHFTDPEGLVSRLARCGRKLVTIVDPHVKRDSGYDLYREVRGAGLCVQRDGAAFDGWCWPGSSVYPDFTDPRMRSLWAWLFGWEGQSFYQQLAMATGKRCFLSSCASTQVRLPSEK